MLAATRFGLGISTDSVAYMAEARALREGRGLQVPTGIYEVYADPETAGESVTASHFPPLFPVLLALVAGSNDDATSAGRGLNALLLAIAVVIVASMVQTSTGSRGTALVAACLVALSPAVVRTHAMVWSEPLFTALGLLGLLALARYLERGRVATLVLASASVALAWLTRYAGIAFVLTGVLVLAVAGPAPKRRPVVLFLALSSLPMAAFLTVMASVRAGGSGYTLAVHAPTVPALRAGWESLRASVLPGELPSWPGLAARLCVAGIVSTLFARGFRTSSSRPRRDPKRAPLQLLLSVFLIVYAAVLLLATVMFAEPVPLEERMLVPAYVVAVALVACSLGRRVAERGLARQIVLFVVGAIAVATATAGVQLVGAGATDDRSFTSPAWALSDDVRQISGLPVSMRIYSNFPEAVYFATGRRARLLPKLKLSDGHVNRRYGGQLSRVAEDVRAGRGAVVLFTMAGRSHLPDPTALTIAVGTGPSAADVTSYQWVTRR